ncbi:LmbU family transcriptional regulator [Amycolatopsis sp. NPDC058340]|uniref:LmbU family transcriptional regulator n=1 Tax=Amycolatopsis sp. NPDC058340 TaxID=3346453 RepID=UPI0036632163
MEESRRIVPGAARRPDTRVLITRVGLHLPSSITYEKWEQAGLQLSRVADSSAWCLGDWIVFGESRYRDRYKQATEAAGLDYKTIRNYAWVARKVDLSRRREKLSFQHHAEVAALPREDQEFWLDQAEESGWSRNELRRRIRGSQGKFASTPERDVIPRIEVTRERIERWQTAARAVDTDLSAWIVANLDAAAGSVLLPNPS